MRLRQNNDAEQSKLRQKVAFIALLLTIAYLMTIFFPEPWAAVRDTLSNESSFGSVLLLALNGWDILGPVPPLIAWIIALAPSRHRKDCMGDCKGKCYEWAA